MANKRTIRNAIVTKIVKTALRKNPIVPSEDANPLMYWQNTEEFTKVCNLMQEHGITRKSIYCTIEMLLYAHPTACVLLPTIKDFCFTFLPTNNKGGR